MTILLWIWVFYKKADAIECAVKNQILIWGDDEFQDAATDKQWKEYINKKYHFDPPVCSNYSEN